MENRKRRGVIIALAMGTALCGCGRNGGGTGMAAGAENGTQMASAYGTEEERPEKSGVLAEGAEGVSWNGEAAEGGAGGVPGKGEAVEGGSEAPGGSSAGRQTEVGSGTVASQGGPYGEISVILPKGWKYEAYSGEELVSGSYGIHFYPEDAEEGFIELVYMDSFGVCGTGLVQEDAEIAGSPAVIGTYDGHGYWDFISFQEQNEGVVALAYSVEGWWEEKEDGLSYGDTVKEILDTLSFDRDKKEGGAFILKKESENQDIGLLFSLKGISPTGATLVYNQYNGEAPTGRLEDGDDFVIERLGDGKWEEVPVVVIGEYGFHAIAYEIPNEGTTERELSWEWLYGQLPPGEYRLRKRITDFRKTADYDEHILYAYFILG